MVVNMYFPRWSSQRGFDIVEVVDFSHGALGVLALFFTKDLSGLVLTENPFNDFRTMGLLSSGASSPSRFWLSCKHDVSVLVIF